MSEVDLSRFQHFRRHISAGHGAAAAAITTEGVMLHYVMGGQGPLLVLLHGWPETWYAWRRVLPALAQHFTVLAPDLRGLGDSSKPLAGYDTNTVSSDIRQLGWRSATTRSTSSATTGAPPSPTPTRRSTASRRASSVSWKCRSRVRLGCIADAGSTGAPSKAEGSKRAPDLAQYA